MARRRYSFTTPELNTTAAAKTLLELQAPTDQAVILTEVSLWVKGTVVTRQPGFVELLRATAAISGTGTTALTGKPLQSGQPIAPRTTALRGNSANAANGAEGTVGDLIDTIELNPTTGFPREYSLGRETEFDTANAAASGVTGLGRLIRLRVTFPDSNELAVVRFVIEE